MLKCCEDFANAHHLKFNPDKTQLIKFLTQSSSSGPLPAFKFCGTQLKFFASVSHLGNILSSNLSDSEDITQKCRDMLVKTNTLSSSFPHLNPSLLTSLFQTYCLSLHGAAPWNVANSSLHMLEVSFNKVLQRIWGLPRASHTRIVHSTAGLQSLVNQTIVHSINLLTAAKKCPSKTVCLIYTEASEAVSTFIGHNIMRKENYIKCYSKSDFLHGDIVRLIRCKDFKVQDIEFLIELLSCN